MNSRRLRAQRSSRLTLRVGWVYQRVWGQVARVRVKRNSGVGISGQAGRRIGRGARAGVRGVIRVREGRICRVGIRRKGVAEIGHEEGREQSRKAEEQDKSRKWRKRLVPEDLAK